MRRTQLVTLFTALISLSAWAHVESSSMVASYSPGADVALLKEAVRRVEDHQVAWQIETITFTALEAQAGWQIAISGSSAEGIFLADAMLPSLPSSRRSYQIPVLRRISYSHDFFEKPADTRYSFFAQLSISDAEREALLQELTATGIQLNFIAGNIFTGRGIRSQILTLAQHPKLTQIEMSRPLYPEG